MRAGSLLTTLCLLGSLVAAHAEDAALPKRDAILTVHGAGKYEVKPDYALFTATVLTPGKTLDEAASAHGPRATQALVVIKKLEPLGFNVEKASFSVDRWRSAYGPAYANQAQTQQFPENPFTARTIFTFKVTSIDRLNEGISEIAATGLFEVGNVTYKIEHERAALNEARRAAVIDAREQAAVYADAADLKLLGVTTVTDGEAKSVDGAADMPMQPFVQIIPPARIGFDASVDMTWRIAPR